MPSRGGLRGASLVGKAMAVRPQLGRILENRRLGLHAGVVMFTSVASAAHVTEQVPASIASGCAVMAAVLIAAVAGFSLVSPARSGKRASHVAASSEFRPYQQSAAQGVGRPLARPAVPDSNLAAELAQAAALAQLTARISHDLRTPLNAVIGFSELMSQETFGPLGSQRYQDYARHIRECGQTLLKSTEDTLAITSALAQPIGEASCPGARPLALAELVEEAWSFVALRASDEAISLDLEMVDGLETFGERRAMRQVLVNLFQDAISRGCPHATIMVRAGVDGHRICLTLETRGCREIRNHDSLPLCVARALLDLHGLPLETRVIEGNTWRASIKLEQALQPDFFFDQHEASPTTVAA